MRKTALALGAGLALTGCADQGVNRFEEQADLASSAVLNQLNGGPITEDNIDQVRLETPGGTLSLVRLCRAAVNNTVVGTEYEMTAGLFSYGEEGGPMVEGTHISSEGVDPSETFDLFQLDFGQETPAAAVVESRWPDRVEIMSAEDFELFVSDIFGTNPNFNCIENHS